MTAKLLPFLFVFGSIGLLFIYICIQAKKENDRINSKLKVENQNFDFHTPGHVNIGPKKILERAVKDFSRKHAAYNPLKDEKRITQGLEEDLFADKKKRNLN